MALIIFFPLGIFAVVFSIQSIIYIRRVSFCFIDDGDGCWRRNMLVTTSSCWLPI